VCAIDEGVITDMDSSVSPCGYCRQFMVEFGKDLTVVQFTSLGKAEIFKLSDLLPHSFGPEDMGK
jgi:cytidine deaminase